MTLTHNRLPVAIAVALAGALLVAGCSSASHSTPAAAASTSASVALPSGLTKQYLTAEKTVLTAIKNGADQMKALKAPAAASDVKAALEPMMTATKTFNQQLDGMPWPAALRSKVTALQDADNAWVTAATNVTGLTGSVQPDKVTGALSAPYDAQVAAVDHLRAAMNLPSL